MANIVSEINRARVLRGQIGKSALNALYPNDFEYYLCAFELVSETKTVDYFVFPIQPSSISKTEPTRNNIKVSMSGTTVLRNKSFLPQEITLKGNFGRRFKILSTKGAFFGVGVSFKIKDVMFGDRMGKTITPSFSSGIKTGYGAVKLLQFLLEESNKVNSNGKPYQLYFYNMAFGESYLVTIPPSGMTFPQSEDKNMIWEYALNLKILAPLSEVATIKHSSLRSQNILGKNLIQNTINIVAKNTKLLLAVNSVYKGIVKI
jgi:hypothetical protein